MICPMCFAKSKNVPQPVCGHSLLLCDACVRGKQTIQSVAVSLKRPDGKSAIRFSDLRLAKMSIVSRVSLPKVTK